MCITSAFKAATPHRTLWVGVPNGLKAADCKSVTLETLEVRILSCPLEFKDLHVISRYASLRWYRDASVGSYLRNQKFLHPTELDFKVYNIRVR